MSPTLNILSVLCLVSSTSAQALPPAYAHHRALILEAEAGDSVGGSIQLSPVEQKADQVLSHARHCDVTEPGKPALPSVHFFQAKDRIKNGQLFPLIQKMPKGAVLHLHSDTMLDVHWLILVATYNPELFVCGVLDGSHTLAFRFTQFKDPSEGPNPVQCTFAKGWVRFVDMRKDFGNNTLFDNLLYKELTLVTDTPRATYPTISEVWPAFQNCIDAVGGLVYYESIYSRYLEEAFEVFRQDGIQHMELRVVMQQNIGLVYNSKGENLSPSYNMNQISNISTSMKMAYPDSFTSVRVILCALRFLPAALVKQAYEEALKLQQMYPDLIAGFDLVGREISGPLIEFVTLFDPPLMDFYFHAGETNRADSQASSNLIDASLLLTKRIGHGYALTHHPEVERVVSDKGIGIEVCPISNQVLMLVDDLRNHPLGSFVANGLPVTISPDDPAVFGGSGSSYDFAIAFMSLGNTSGLASLKQIIINSLNYSALSQPLKAHGIAMWESNWNSYMHTLAALWPSMPPC